MLHVLRDAYIGGLVLAAGGLAYVAPASGAWEAFNPWTALGLFMAMVVAERLCVLVPRDAKVSVATIPHIASVLLLPPWVTMALAGTSMLADQVLARSDVRRLMFNVASVMVTVGMAGLLADRAGLGEEMLGDPGQWQQLPGFLLVAATYYVLTNGFASTVMSLDRGESVWRIFLDTTSFTLPAEFAVCGIGGVVAVLWKMSPPWAPLILFPAVVSQVALSFISSSKRRQARLSFLAEASRVLGQSLDEAELPNRLANLAVPALADMCLVYLIGADGTMDKVAAARAVADRLGLDTQNPDLDVLQTHLADWVSEEALTQHGLTPVAEASRSCAMLPERLLSDLAKFRFRATMAVPLSASSGDLGALILLSTRAQYDPDDFAFAQDLARRSAVALDNAQLHAEARRASRLRDEFLSVAAHELKTPVTVLRGYSQLLGRLLESPDPVVLSKGFQAIESQSEKLGRLTHQLLDVSRIEAGKLRLEKREVDVGVLVRGVAAGVQAGAANHQVQVQVESCCVATVDPLRVEQVLNNLLGNAVKYSPDGGPILVTLERSTPTDISIVIRDWGVGIPTERRANLFDRFYQAHGDGQFGGLGLGLFISRQIVEMHGGKILAEFPKDGGTRFVVSLPVAQQPASAGTSGFAVRSSAALPLERVLVTNSARE